MKTTSIHCPRSVLVKTFLREKVKLSDDGPSVVGSAQRGMRYSEAVSKRQTTNRIIIDNDPILLK